MGARAVAIIQARMGSTRLPGKVLKPIGGRSLLAYLIDRISKARTLAGVLVATTTHSRDQAIIAECDRLGVPHFAGSEFDVLDRYVAAAERSSAEIVVRVTADNPFTDPDSIDYVVDAIESGADYALEMDLPIGTTGEALRRDALHFIDAVANTERWREHVTLYAKENPSSLRCAFLAARTGCNRPDLSFTIDEPAEYEYVQQLAASLPGPNFLLKNLIEFADDSLAVAR